MHKNNKYILYTPPTYSTKTKKIGASVIHANLSLLPEQRYSTCGENNSMHKAGQGRSWKITYLKGHEYDKKELCKHMT